MKTKLFQGVMGDLWGAFSRESQVSFQDPQTLYLCSQVLSSRVTRGQSRIPRVFILGRLGISLGFLGFLFQGSQVSSRTPLGFSSFVSTGHKDYHCLLIWGLYPFLWANGQVLWANKQGWQSPQIVNSLKLFDS